MKTGIVTGYEIGQNADGENNVVKLFVTIDSDEDVQTVEYIQGAQDDSIPENGTAVYIIEVNGNPANKIAIINDSVIESTVLNGEKKIYSQDAGVIKSTIYLKKDGIIEINGNTDFAVRWTTLNSVLQTLVGAINTAFAAKLDGGGSSPALTLDLSTAKVDTVKLPGVTP